MTTENDKRPPGRPRGVTYTRQRIVRFTDEQDAALVEAAEREDRGVSYIIRRIVQVAIDAGVL